MKRTPILITGPASAKEGSTVAYSFHSTMTSRFRFHSSFVAALLLAVLTASAFAGHPGKGDEEDPYNLLPPPGATRDTAGEQFLRTFSPTKAGEYLDLRSHNIEKGCYACHSSGAYMAARPLKISVILLSEYFLLRRSGSEHATPRVYASSSLSVLWS